MEKNIRFFFLLKFEFIFNTQAETVIKYYKHTHTQHMHIERNIE